MNKNLVHSFTLWNNHYQGVYETDYLFISWYITTPLFPISLVISYDSVVMFCVTSRSCLLIFSIVLSSSPVHSTYFLFSHVLHRFRGWNWTQESQKEDKGTIWKTCRCLNNYAEGYLLSENTEHITQWWSKAEHM